MTAAQPWRAAAIGAVALAGAAVAAPFVASLIAAQPAQAQSWQAYSYPDAGFVIQFPASPTVSKGAYRTAAGRSVPAVTYGLKEADITYRVTVADFSNTGAEQQAVIDEAVKALGATGEIKLDVTERIQREYGRQLSLAGKDGGRSMISVFFVKNRLYELEGRALPPDPAVGVSKAVRFQQSLGFLGD